VLVALVVVLPVRPDWIGDSRAVGVASGRLVYGSGAIGA